MSITVIRPKDREEWLEYRKSGIGSSEIATIVGLNPWETPYQLWRRKRGLDPAKEETFAMKAGHYIEDAVARFWSDSTGREVIKSSAGDWLIRDNERPFLQVSPDRTYWLAGKKHNKDNKGVLECKTTQMQIDSEDIPKHWFCQVQYQLGTGNYQFGSLAWLCSGREFGYKDITLNRDFYEWLAGEAECFWTDYIKGGLEPSAMSVKDVLLKYNRHTDGKIVEVNESVFDSWEELKKVKDEIAALDERKKTLEDTLKECFGDAEAISYEGQTLATWKAPKPSMKFDDKRFKTEHPDLANEYMKEVQNARRLLLK